MKQQCFIIEKLEETTCESYKNGKTKDYKFVEWF